MGPGLELGGTGSVGLSRVGALLDRELRVGRVIAQGLAEAAHALRIVADREAPVALGRPVAQAIVLAHRHLLAEDVEDDAERVVGRRVQPVACGWHRVRNGAPRKAGAAHAKGEARAHPSKIDGPTSKLYLPPLCIRLKVCAEPPGLMWLSSTSTLCPYLAEIAPQARPPMPLPMTMMSYSPSSPLRPLPVPG